MTYDIRKEQGLVCGVASDPAERTQILYVDDRGDDRHAQVFKRNAIGLGGKAQTWLVGELNGVRVYVIEGGKKILMTDADVYYSRTLIPRLIRGEYD